MSTLLGTTPNPKTDSPHATGILGSSSRMASLDGIRGIALILVLYSHTLTGLVGIDGSPWHNTALHGVTVFFVLSGYLITSKLIEERMRLRDFYVRRFFRLMPAAWTYLAFLLLLNRLTGVNFTSLAEVRSCVFFYRNFATVPGPGIAGHFWSLSVEEQFYLCWPCLLLFVGLRRGRWLALAAALVCALYRWVFWSHYADFSHTYRTEVRADAVLIGCFLALVLTDPELARKASKCVRWMAVPALGVFVYCIARFQALSPLCENISIAILIAACVLWPKSSWSRTLSWKPLAWLGVVSYSAYLWQGLFVQLGRTLPQKIVSLLTMVLFSLGSYHLIEKPCTAFAKKSWPTSSGPFRGS